MKKCHFLFMLVFSFLGSLHAQVKIGGVAEIPHPSAVLELDGGNNRGLLLPRMRTMDIFAIQNPAEGLTIYATDQQAIYLRRSGNWVKMNGVADAFSLPYSGVFSESIEPVLSLTNNINGGIGIYGASGIGAGTGVHGYAFNGFGYGVKGTAIFGRGAYFSSRNSHALITDSGRVGFGTLSPTAFMEVDATKSDASNTIIINDDDDPTIQFRKAGINKSFIRQQGNDLVLRPNDQNFTGKVILQAYNQGGWLFVDANGNASLGQDPATFAGTPNNVRMHIKSTNKNVLALEAVNGTGDGPTLNFIERTGNTTNSTASIYSNMNAMTFKSTAQRYEWAGSGSLLPIDNSSAGMILKRSDAGPFYYYSLGVAGFIGAGTANPEAQVHIVDNSFFAAGAPSMIIDNYVSALVTFRKNGADKGFIQQLDNDLKIGTVAANDPGRFIVRTNGLDRLWVDSVGYVTIGGKIGPTISGPYRLAVRGKIAATDFNVVASGSWPDYVFDPSYKLRSLEETEAFIKANKHLPNIPAAAVVDKEGFALGDMQKRMMEKIEELTLYLIEANKNIQQQQKEIDALKKRIDKPFRKK